MNAIETKSIVEQALRDPQNFPWVAWIVVAIGTTLISFLVSYLRRKGDNRATKEDIAALTELVERVRSQHAERLENLAHENRKALDNTSREHQLRLAALDRRLDAHQQAFALWRRLNAAMYTERLDGVVSECQKWWDNNCLYLDSQAREAFGRAYQAAHNHVALLSGFDRGIVTEERIEQNGDIIRSAGPAIVIGAALPPIKDFTTEGILAKDDTAA
jgi:hypothetical protein